MVFDIIPITSKSHLDCGATCLKMLLSYYGNDVPLIDITRECNTRLIGCTAADVKRAGDKYGIDTTAYNMDADDLFQQDKPAIVWWKYHHFCVYCGCDEDGNVVICNPDRGRYRMSKGMFRTMYSGVALFNGEVD